MVSVCVPCFYFHEPSVIWLRLDVVQADSALLRRVSVQQKVAQIINQSPGKAETRCRRCPSCRTRRLAFISVDGLTLAMFSLLSEVKLDLEGPSPLEPDGCPLLMDFGNSPSTGIAEYFLAAYGLSWTTSS